MKKIKVLMIGNHQSVKGGITSVIQQLLSFDWDSVGVEMKFIPTYIEASGIKKIAYFIRAYMNIEKEMRRNKPDIVHIHMSYRGSFYRKYAIHKLCKNTVFLMLFICMARSFKSGITNLTIGQKRR